MEGCRRRQLGGSLSAGELMRLASQAREPPSGLLSLAAVEQLRDTEQRDTIPWAPPLMSETSGSWFQSGKASAPSTGLGPLRKRAACSQELWRNSLDLEDVSRHNRGVSSCTRRENLSQEEVTGKLDTSQAIARRRGLKGGALAQQDPLLLESPRARKQNIDLLTAEFKEEVSAMESQIADIGKSLQMSRFSNDEEDAEAKLQEEREAEKKRREIELRKARLQEKNARDPHRKIQLRLAYKRRFEMDTLDQAGIPETDVVFQGLKGCEKMRLVDVQALRSKCQGLSEGIHSVDKLVELKQRKEHPLRVPTPGNLQMSTSMPSFGFEGRSGPPSRGRCQRVS